MFPLTMRAMVFVCVVAAFLVIAVQQGDAVESQPAPADWSKYPYVLYIGAGPFHFVGLAISKKYVLASIWLSGIDPELIDLYVGDPKSSPARIASIGGVGFLSNSLMFVIKSCTRLSSVSQGMALTPSKFSDRSADSPASLLFFTKDRELQYLNTTVLSKTNCVDVLADQGDDDVDVEQYACTETDTTTGSCSYFSDGNTWISLPALLINNHPNGFLLNAVCDTTPLPATLYGSTIYSTILPNKALIMDYTGGAVDVP